MIYLCSALVLCSSVSDNKLPTESLKTPQFVQNATFYMTIPLKGAFKEKLKNQNLNNLSFFYSSSQCA